LTFLNDFLEPTLAADALCVGVMEIRRSIPSKDHQDAVPEPIFIDIIGNTIEFGPDHESYSSIVESKYKSILTFNLKLERCNSSIKAVLHLDTLEGNADNLALKFDPTPLLVPGENDTYFLTAEQPLKLDIFTTDSTGRPSERGLGHIGKFAFSRLYFRCHILIMHSHIRS
jgi:hypothetical protein